MTRLDIQNRILTALNDSTTAPVFWSTTQIQNVIQDGMEVLAEEAAAIKRTAFVTCKDGTQYYSTRGTAQDMLIPYRLWVPTLSRRLRATTVDQLDAYHETWETVQNDPEFWFPMGWDWFGVWPHPATGGLLLHVDYLAWPRALLDDSDGPEFPESDHDALVLYGVYDGLLKRWDVPQATVLFSLFMEKFGKAVAKSGMRTLQARTWQAEKAPGSGFRSGLPSRFD